MADTRPCSDLILQSVMRHKHRSEHIEDTLRTYERSNHSDDIQRWPCVAFSSVNNNMSHDIVKDHLLNLHPMQNNQKPQTTVIYTPCFAVMQLMCMGSLNNWSWTLTTGVSIVNYSGGAGVEIQML